MGGGNGRVLVVDDEPQVRNALARTVRCMGLVPVVAATAEEAVALAQDDEFDVVLTDIGMPGVDGLSMLRRISPIQPNARFVIVTGRTRVEQQSLPKGHRCKVIRKPWSQERLEAAIRGDEQGTPSTIPPPADSNSPPTRVLLVAAEEADALLFDAMLRLAYPDQFSVVHASSLPDAQRLIALEPPDVVALDLDIDATHGLQTLVRLQSDAPGLGTVVFSGVEDPDLELRAVQVGAQDYLLKGKASGAAIGKALRHAEERKRVEKRLAELAFHDQLTGLANRVLLRQRIAQAVARSGRTGESFAVLVLDLDRFKSVNDALGHDAGDVYLQQVSERLRRATRETDTVARLGGDEFAVLAEPISRARDVDSLARRVLALLGAPLEVSGVTLTPTASVGAAIFPQSGDGSDSLLSAADAAMYVVKGKGRNGYHVHGVELTRQIAKRMDLEARLRKTIEQTGFELHYQPLVAVDGTLRGAEALLRWPTTDGCPTVAADFIPILEESGMIVELGDWIARRACEQLASWRGQGLRVDRMAVNISAKQLARPGLRNMLTQAVDASQLSPNDLELELTETALINDTKATAQVLGELSQSGFRLALDDFGTGYSSLAHLDAFPIDTLKIDCSFVRDIATDAYRRNLVGGIVHLAQRLGLDVIAEGVENEDQLHVLRDQGCPMVQGRHLYAPVDGMKFKKALNRAITAVLDTTPVPPTPRPRQVLTRGRA